MPLRPHALAWPIAFALVAGCVAKPHVTAPVRAAASVAPAQALTTATRMVAQVGAAAVLAGRVTLIANNGGSVIANNGGSLISDGGGGIVSDNGGGILSNNGGGLVSDNGGGIVSNNGGAYRLASAKGLAAYRLADAVITLVDATGKTLVDDAGKPLTATSDKQGGYSLKAVLPKGNLIAKVTLWNGGTLSALVVPDGSGRLAVDLDTASTLGAAYVLDQYVKGDQAVYDRLPFTAARHLKDELDVVKQYLAGVPSYQDKELVAATTALRAKVATVDRTLEDVKALLLGQARLGSGRPATQVPLAQPRGLTYMPDGSLILGEFALGRVRRVAADGTMSTVADASSDTIKANFPRLADVQLAPDGSLYVATLTSDLVYRIGPDSVASVFMGAEGDFGPLAGIRGTHIRPNRLALGADGTFYVAESTRGIYPQPPRLLKVKAGGNFEAIPVDAAWGSGAVNGLVLLPDGSLYLGYVDESNQAKLYRVVDGQATRVFPSFTGDLGDMQAGPDGTLYVSQPRQHRVVAIAPDGTITPVAGAGAPVGADELVQPTALAFDAAGTLAVGDDTTGVVHALRPDGNWRAIAGTESVVDAGEGSAFAINQPIGVTFGPDGALYVVEAGAGRVRRYLGGELAPFIGGPTDDDRDGIPAIQAHFGIPSAIARSGSDFFVGDLTTRKVRHMGADGLIDTPFGGVGQFGELAVGEQAPAKDRPTPPIAGLAVDAKGRVYFSSSDTSQIWRFTPGADGGTLACVAGKAQGNGGDTLNPLSYVGNDDTDPLARLGYPMGIAFDPQGRLCVAEMFSGGIRRLEGLDGDGPPKVSRVAGRSATDQVGILASGTVPPDGESATDASLFLPTGLTFDAAGTMYITEAGTLNFSALGNVVGATFLVSGDGGSLLKLPKVTGRVRKVTPDGKITTVAGVGSRYFNQPTGDDALVMPFGVAVAPDGRLAIADLGANLIRILPAGSY